MTKLCEHCGKNIGKMEILIVPSILDISFGAKVESICRKCAKKEGRVVK